MTLYFKFERQTRSTLWKGIPAHIYIFLKFWLKNWKWMDLIPKIGSHKSLKKTKKWNIHMTTSKTSWSWKWWQLFPLSNRRNFLYSLDYLLYIWLPHGHLWVILEGQPHSPNVKLFHYSVLTWKVTGSLLVRLGLWAQGSTYWDLNQNVFWFYQNALTYKKSCFSKLRHYDRSRKCLVHLPWSMKSGHVVGLNYFISFNDKNVNKSDWPITDWPIMLYQYHSWTCSKTH